MRVIIHPTYFSNLFFPFSFLFSFLPIIILSSSYPFSLFRNFSREERTKIPNDPSNPKRSQFDETRVSLSKTFVATCEFETRAKQRVNRNSYPHRCKSDTHPRETVYIYIYI